jgi:hypothetical protein
MFFWNKFCGLVLILLITGHCSPAQTTTLQGQNADFSRNRPATSASFIHFIPQTFNNVNSLQNIKQIVPANFYTCNIGFFCKKELLIEKTTKIPLRFRVGSLEQCNYYEGKKQ